MADIKISELPTREPLASDKVPVMSADGTAVGVPFSSFTDVPPAGLTTYGGITAKERTSESSEAAIDPVTGRMYVSSGGQSQYDLIIDTQAKFDTMIESPTWMGGKHILLKGNFVLVGEFGDTPIVSIPSTVKTLDGIKGITTVEVRVEGGTISDSIIFRVNGNNTLVSGIEIILQQISGSAASDFREVTVISGGNGSNSRCENVTISASSIMVDFDKKIVINSFRYINAKDCHANLASIQVPEGTQFTGFCFGDISENCVSNLPEGHYGVGFSNCENVSYCKASGGTWGYMGCSKIIFCEGTYLNCKSVIAADDNGDVRIVASGNEEGFKVTADEVTFNGEPIEGGGGGEVTLLQRAGVALNEWAEKTLPVSDNWQSISINDRGQAVTMVSESNQAAYSSDGGQTWTASTLPSFAEWHSLSINDQGHAVAVTFNSDKAAYSTNGGQTWTESTLPFSASWISVSINNQGKVVAVAIDSAEIAQSSDGGKTWATLPFTPPSEPVHRTGWWSVSINDQDQILALVRGSDINGDFLNEVAYSADGGQTWGMFDLPTLPSSANWSSVAINDQGQAVAVPDSSNQAAYSADGGQTWALSSLPYSGVWEPVSMNNQGQAITVARNSDQSAYSIDGGQTWATSILPSNERWNSASVNNRGEVVSVASDFPASTTSFQTTPTTLGDADRKTIGTILPEYNFIPNDLPGTAGQVLTKTADGEEWADSTGGGVPEAPSDGKQYARQDKTWTEVTGGSGADPVYDKVVKTQAELDAMLASSTWLGATNVLLIGTFTVSKTLTEADQSAPIKLPENVQSLSGISGETVVNATVINNIGMATPTDIPAIISSGVTMQEIMSEPPTFKKSLKDMTVNVLSIGGSVSGMTLMGIIGFTEISGVTYKIPEGATLISNDYPCIVMSGYAANCNVVVDWVGDSGSKVTAYNGIFSGVRMSCDLSNVTESGGTTAFARCSGIVGAYDNTVNPTHPHTTAMECFNMSIIGDGLIEGSGNIQLLSGVSSAGLYSIAIQDTSGDEGAVDGYFEFTPTGLTLNGNPLGGGGIPDAPSDGKQYARQDEEWTEVTGGGSSGENPIYDKVIKTQAEFDLMIASDTWLDAKNVLIAGQFTLSKNVTTADYTMLNIPATVSTLSGINPDQSSIEFRPTISGTINLDLVGSTPTNLENLSVTLQTISKTNDTDEIATLSFIRSRGKTENCYVSAGELAMSPAITTVYGFNQVGAVHDTTVDFGYLSSGIQNQTAFFRAYDVSNCVAYIEPSQSPSWRRTGFLQCQDMYLCYAPEDIDGYEECVRVLLCENNPDAGSSGLIEAVVGDATNSKMRLAPFWTQFGLEMTATEIMFNRKPLLFGAATEATFGGIKAKARTSETQEVVIDADTGKAYVSASEAGGVPEAPTDGKQYARQNSSWSEIPTSTVQAYTILAAGWSEGSYTFTGLGNTANTDISVLPSPIITADQLAAYQAANVIGGTQATDNFTCKAFGAIPTIDIPVIVVITGGLSVAEEPIIQISASYESSNSPNPYFTLDTANMTPEVDGAQTNVNYTISDI